MTKKNSQNNVLLIKQFFDNNLIEQNYFTGHLFLRVWTKPRGVYKFVGVTTTCGKERPAEMFHGQFQWPTAYIVT